MIMSVAGIVTLFLRFMDRQAGAKAGHYSMKGQKTMGTKRAICGFFSFMRFSFLVWAEYGYFKNCIRAMILHIGQYNKRNVFQY